MTVHPAESECPSQTAGNLQYNSAQIVRLFGFLLWGWFCLDVMEFVIPAVITLKIKSLNASSSWITMLLSVIPGVVNFSWNPFVSTWSDRHRGPMGRRIPFLIAGTPVVVLMLVGLGYCDDLGAAVSHYVGNFFSTVGAVLAVITVMVVGFQMANIMVYNLYFALFNDVVPRSMMGQFALWFRTVGTLASVAFNFLLFSYCEKYMTQVLIISGLTYAASYVLMCLMVKEGSYPTPPTKGVTAHRWTALWREVRQYVTVCFGHPIYLYIFLHAGFWTASCVMTPFFLLMNRNLGLNLQEIGWIQGSAGILSIPAYLLTGWLMRRFQLLRLYVATKVLQAIAVSGFMIYLFYTPPARIIMIMTVALNLFMLCANAIMLVTGVPVMMMIFPRSHYGQFCSANAIANGVLGILGGLGGGLFMDLMLKLYSGDGFAYRYAAVWATLFAILSAWCTYMAYLHVRKMHGDDFTTFEMTVRAAH